MSPKLPLTTTPAPGSSDMATPVIQEEAKEQESVFAKKKQSEISNMAKEFLNKSCFMVHWGHKVLKIGRQSWCGMPAWTLPKTYLPR